MGLNKKNKRRETNTLLSPSSSFRSSSHRKQDSVSPATSSKTTNVGCMSGIFQFLARYHTRRKFLTIGNKKQERNGNIHSPTEPPPGKSDQQLKPEKTVTCQPCDHNSTVLDRLPPDHAPPRSPAILPEIQRSSTNKTVINPPRVVERLMGLDDFPAIIPAPAPIKGMSSAYEKRRKLLGDLEKCDKDLKALKKIIDTVRAAQTPPRMVKMERGAEAEEAESEVGSEGPSPVSVLDRRLLSPGYSKKIMHDQLLQQQKTKHQMYTNKKQGDHHEEKANNYLNKSPPSSIIIDHTTTPQTLHFPTRITTQQVLTNTTFTATETETEAQTETWSKAMKESVIEVCQIVESGQTQEVRGIGLLLQDFIFKELIDEITKDLCNVSYLHVFRNTSLSLNLPFDACKRKLFL